VYLGCGDGLQFPEGGTARLAFRAVHLGRGRAALHAVLLCGFKPASACLWLHSCEAKRFSLWFSVWFSLCYAISYLIANDMTHAWFLRHHMRCFLSTYSSVPSHVMGSIRQHTSAYIFGLIAYSGWESGEDS
jgi:hypothetical protein